ncbi:hypothetical protein M3Y96_00003800 [Aphelenchoides besseyi]|nr:hypothetical protein M3Y96_00003800 [Aphelenchoides besseyi]
MKPGRFVFMNFTAEDCTYAMNLQHDCRLLIAYMIQVVMAAIALASILFMWLAPKFRQSQSLLSDSIKIVFSAGFIFYIICPIITLLFYLYLILISLLPFKSCFYIWSNISCYIPRYSAYYCTVGFTISHITVLVERLHTMLSPQKQTSKSYAYAIAVLLAPLPILTWCYALDDFDGYRIYPMPGSSSNIKRVLTIKIASAWIDGFTLFVDFILLLYNRRQLRM